MAARCAARDYRTPEEEPWAVGHGRAADCGIVGSWDREVGTGVVVDPVDAEYTDRQ